MFAGHQAKDVYDELNDKSLVLLKSFGTKVIKDKSVNFNFSLVVINDQSLKCSFKLIKEFSSEKDDMRL